MRTIEKIILGTVQMGLPYGIMNGGKLAYSESEEILIRAHEAGIKELDTAEAYGKAHEVIGRFHKSHDQNRFNILTKIHGTSNFPTVSKVEKYLKDMGVDTLEAVMFHSYDMLREKPGTIKTLNNLKKKGILSKIGVSIYTNDQLKNVLQHDSLDLIQLPFNLLDNFSIRGPLLREAKKRGKIVHSRSVFLQGLFFKSPQDDNLIVRQLKPQLIKLQQIAEKEKTGMVTLALNYALQQKYIDKVLIGVDNLNQLEENISCIGYELSERCLQEINSVITEDQRLLNPSLWNQRRF